MNDIIQENNARALLKKVRIHLALSQKDISEILSVSPQTVSAWECGRRKIHTESIQKLFDAFDISLEDFIDAQIPIHASFDVFYCRKCGNIKVVYENQFNTSLVCCGNSMSNLSAIPCYTGEYIVKTKNNKINITIAPNKNIKYILYITKTDLQIKFFNDFQLYGCQFPCSNSYKLYVYTRDRGMLRLK